VHPVDDAHALTANPQLVAPGQAGFGLATLSGYALRDGSPAIDSGKAIENAGGKDFLGTAVPQCGAVDRGAIESSKCQHAKEK
jgi:hypothetical protein